MPTLHLADMYCRTAYEDDFLSKLVKANESDDTVGGIAPTVNDNS